MSAIFSLHTVLVYYAVARQMLPEECYTAQMAIIRTLPGLIGNKVKRDNNVDENILRHM